MATPRHHREHRRERGDGHGHRHSSRQNGDANMVLSPAPAHVKSSSRRPGQERHSSARDIGSVQPLAPASRRQSQQQREALNSVGISSPHPYATAPSPNGYRQSSTTNYGRQSPSALQLVGNGMPNNGSESFLYAHGAPKAPSKDGTMGDGRLHSAGAVRSMNVYDRQPMTGGAQQIDEDQGQKGFFGIMCCR
jgi:casein kinase 1